MRFAHDLSTEPRVALREVLAELGDKPQRIGMRLANLIGYPVDGYELERVTVDRTGAVFCVVVAP